MRSMSDFLYIVGIYDTTLYHELQYIVGLTSIARNNYSRVNLPTARQAPLAH